MTISEQLPVHVRNKLTFAVQCRNLFTVACYQYPPFWAAPLVVDQSAGSHMRKCYVSSGELSYLVQRSPPSIH